MNKHAYAEILLAIAEGKDIQWQEMHGTWEPQSHSETLSEIARKACGPSRYRVKPPTISISGKEVPAPLKEAPIYGTVTYYPSFSLENPGSIWVESFEYRSTGNQEQLLDHGLLHETAAGAQAHAMALMSITQNY